jgi:hypothetical protein
MNYSEKIKDKLNALLQHASPKENQQLYLTLCQHESSSNMHSIISSFFSEHNLYYVQTSELYISYQNHQYKVLTENDIIHLIFKNLNVYPMNTALKQQIKCKIQKKIKERSIYNVIPDSVTLQEMISFLHPLLFDSKNGAKYFMTTLGDTIMKKSSLYYFLDPSMKPLIQKIQKIVSLYLCSNQLSNFKFKYCDHDPSLSRILKTNHINMNYLRCEESLYLNLIFCSIHYSNRFQDGDDFLKDITNQQLRQEVMWVKEANKEVVLQDFITSYFYRSETGIHEKDVLFLWKMYLKEKNRVNVFKNIQEDLSLMLFYDPPYYRNISSMRMPFVKKFTQFWNKYIYDDPTEKDLELTEILSMFMETYPKYTDMDEPKIKDMIQYYYPDTILENRFVHHKGCLLWNKKEELHQFLSTINTCEQEVYPMYIVSSFKRKVSKQYFTSFYEQYKYLNTEP